MPLITNPKHVREILAYYREKRIAIPCFCAENTFTMEGILKGASDVANASETDAVLFLAVTGNYHGRQQLKNYTSLKDTWEGYLAFRSDLERLCRTGGPFDKLKVIPSLDHGQPELDESLFEKGKDFWGCVMYDCSTFPLDQNRDKVKEFVQRYKSDFVVEGCVDEITEAGQGGMKLTDPREAKEFIEQTGADLIVANLGTEHRVTGDKKQYQGDLAKKIFEMVGHRIVLHGTSCLSKDDLIKLRHDGIAKVNIWTVLETKTSQEMTLRLIERLRNILPEDTISKMVDEGWLGKRYSNKSMENPELKVLTEVYRRDEIKVPSVAKMVRDFMKVFGF